MAENTVYTVAVPGAQLHYEVRGSGPVLALIGLPMTAPEFTRLAGQQQLVVIEGGA